MAAHLVTIIHTRDVRRALDLSGDLRASLSWAY